MRKNELAIIIKESGLETAKAKYLLENFKNYFDIAEAWEKKAKSIIVTKASQIETMEQARTGRLFLKEKRIAIEKSRKKLKENVVLEGKAIDGIANILKALIVPIEEYLDKQENFIHFREEAKAEKARQAEENRLAKEALEEIKRKEQEEERLRIENEALRKKNDEQQKKFAANQEKQRQAIKDERERNDKIRRAKEAEVQKEREEQNQKIKAEREANDKLRKDQEDKLQKERAEQNEKIRVEREKNEKIRREQEDKIRKERDERLKKEAEARKEKERLEELLKNQVECPACHHKFQLKQEGKE